MRVNYRCVGWQDRVNYRSDVGWSLSYKKEKKQQGCVDCRVSVCAVGQGETQ